jgi:hypothetical protein
VGTPPNQRISVTARRRAHGASAERSNPPAPLSRTYLRAAPSSVPRCRSAPRAPLIDMQRSWWRRRAGHDGLTHLRDGVCVGGDVHEKEHAGDCAAERRDERGCSGNAPRTGTDLLPPRISASHDFPSYGPLSLWVPSGCQPMGGAASTESSRRQPRHTIEHRAPVAIQEFPRVLFDHPHACPHVLGAHSDVNASE